MMKEEFYRLDDYEAGFMEPASFGEPLDDPEEEGSKWLEEKRQELIVKPVRAMVAEIFGDSVSFLKGDFWKKIQETLETDPDDPDAVFELAKKLLDSGSKDHLVFAKRLICLPDTDGEIKLRWPDFEDHRVLAACLFRQDLNFGAVIKVLTDEQGQPLYPENEHARKLFARAANELHRFEMTAKIVRNTDREDLYQDPALMVHNVRALQKLEREDDIYGLFSGVNPLFRQYGSTRFIRPVLQLLHEERRYDLMLYICCQLLIVRPECRNQENFVDFASRSFNEAREYRASIKLLASSEDPIRARFPRNIFCVKNLAYALIGLKRRPDAEAVVEEAVRTGLPRDQLAHLRSRLSGGIRPRGRRATETEL